MARELVVYCDACLPQNVQEPGHLVTVSIDGAPATGFDLCERHDKELLNPVRELMGQAGIPAARLLQDQPATPPKRRGAGDSSLGLVFDCPACPDVSYTQLQSLRAHFLAAHDYDTEGRQSVFMYGTTCPLCNEETDNELGRYHVPYTHPEIKGGGAGLFAAAIAAGDRYKVVKKQLDHVRSVLTASERKRR